MEQSYTNIVCSYLFDTTTFKQIIIGSATFVTVRIVLFFYNRYRVLQTFKNLGIPGPKPNLWDGNLSEYLRGKAPFKVVEQWRGTYGKVFGYYLGDTNFLIIADPKLLRKFIIDNQAVFVGRTKLYIDAKPISQSVLFIGGDRWKVVRKTLTPAFSQYRMKGEEATKFIDDSIAMVLNYMAKKHRECKQSNQPTIVDIQGLMKSTALHLISNMAINMDGLEVEEDAKHVKILDEYLNQADGPVVHMAIRLPMLRALCSFIGNHISLGVVLTSILKELNSRMDKQLADMKDEAKTLKYHNIFEIMVQLHNEGSLTRPEVLGNSLAILFAGYDTTATTLSYFFWVLSKYTDIQEKLRAEIISHGSESTYLKMVLNETMRLYPTVTSFTQRTSSRDITIDGLNVKKDFILVVNSYIIHRDPEIWPEPLKFDPERFSDMSKIDSCAFVPFGVGQRLCLGYQLAMLEMRLIITELLMTYKFNLVSPNVLDLVTSAHVMTKPSETIKLRIEPLYNK